jgi:hypothetical protein
MRLLLRVRETDAHRFEHGIRDARRVAIREPVCPCGRLDAETGDVQRNYKCAAAGCSLVAARPWHWWRVCRAAVAFSMQILRGALLVHELLRILGF